MALSRSSLAAGHVLRADQLPEARKTAIEAALSRGDEGRARQLAAPLLAGVLADARWPAAETTAEPLGLWIDAAWRMHQAGAGARTGRLGTRQFRP